MKLFISAPPIWRDVGNDVLALVVQLITKSASFRRFHLVVSTLTMLRRRFGKGAAARLALVIADETSAGEQITSRFVSATDEGPSSGLSFVDRVTGVGPK